MDGGASDEFNTFEAALKASWIELRGEVDAEYGPGTLEGKSGGKWTWKERLLYVAHDGDFDPEITHIRCKLCPSRPKLRIDDKRRFRGGGQLECS